MKEVRIPRTVNDLIEWLSDISERGYGYGHKPVYLVEVKDDGKKVLYPIADAIELVSEVRLYTRMPEHRKEEIRKEFGL